MSAVRVATPPKIDGVLDDEAWRLIRGSEVFTQKFPDEGRAPSERTRVSIAYDDAAVYVAFECHQTSSPLVRRLARRDRQVESDAVSISLDTKRDGKSAFEFWVNAAGVLADSIRFNDTDASSDWDENWDARVALTSDGWSAELVIPLRILRYASAPEQEWGMEVRRFVSARQETDEWAFIPRAVAGEVSHYGKLSGLVGLDAKTNLEIRPFVLAKLTHQQPTDDVVSSGTSPAVSAGFDLRWHATQDLTLDASVNPDFAQVEADQLVLNLSNVEIRYPEKRPFFLEGIDAFSTPLGVLYTRRIGRAPAAPALRREVPFGEKLYALPTPATVYGAAKLTGRVSETTSVATLTALTGRNDVTVQAGDGTRAARLVDPLTAYGVARVKREIGENAHVGAIVTTVSRSEQGADYPLAPDGSGQVLCPSGTQIRRVDRCFHDAYVTGIDGRWRSPSGSYSVTAQAIASAMRGGPPRTLSDGTVIGSSDVAPGAMVSVSKDGGEHVVFYGEYDYFGRKLDTNDLGYLRRQNLNALVLAGGWRTLDPYKSWLETRSGIEVTARNNLDGLNVYRNVSLSTWGKLDSFWSYYFELHYRPPRFDDREVGDGTALERGAVFGSEQAVSSDPRAAVTFGAFLRAEKISTGVNYEGDGGVNVRPIPALDIGIGPNFVYTHGEPRFAGGGALPGQYVFGSLAATSIGATLRATYTFTPRLTLQTYAQLFLASEHFSSFSVVSTDPAAAHPTVRLADLGATGAPTGNPDVSEGALNVNVVLRWEWSVGSTLYVVYTRSQSPTTSLGPGAAGSLDLGAVRRAPATDVLLTKASFFLPL